MNEHQLRRGWILCAAVVVGAASLAAQQPEQQSRPAGSLAERFKQLDRNGERRLLMGTWAVYPGRGEDGLIPVELQPWRAKSAPFFCCQTWTIMFDVNTLKLYRTDRIICRQAVKSASWRWSITGASAQ
jgi:hypothetical protein